MWWLIRTFCTKCQTTDRKLVSIPYYSHFWLWFTRIRHVPGELQVWKAKKRPVSGDCAFQAYSAGHEEKRPGFVLKELQRITDLSEYETQLYLRKSWPKIADHFFCLIVELLLRSKHSDFYSHHIYPRESCFIF